MERLFVFVVFVFLLSTSVSGYVVGAPVLVENVRATPDAPYVVEGFEIRSDSENCVVVRDSENVVIRENYLHECVWSDPDNPYSWYRGYAVLVKDSKNVTIERNTVQGNNIGIVAIDSTGVRILDNEVRQTLVTRPIGCEFCSDVEIAGNVLLDNGNPDWFWVPGQRIIGIFVVASSEVDIHDNTIIRSSSDGISVSGQVDGVAMVEGRPSDWTPVSRNIRVYNNLILDNLELGVWLSRIDNIEVFNNTIRDHYGGVVLDFNVENSKVYGNRILVWVGYPVSLGVSHNNHIFNNTGYCFDCSFLDSAEFVVEVRDNPESDGIKSSWAKIPYSPSSGNVIEGNVAYKLGGPLKDVLLAKNRRVHEERILEEKGWFACEIAEGLLDQECVAREEAKGFQGMPREVFVFDPLMEDFDAFVVDDGVERRSVMFLLSGVVLFLLVGLVVWVKRRRAIRSRGR